VSSSHRAAPAKSASDPDAPRATAIAAQGAALSLPGSAAVRLAVLSLRHEAVVVSYHKEKNFSPTNTHIMHNSWNLVLLLASRSESAQEGVVSGTEAPPSSYKLQTQLQMVHFRDSITNRKIRT
jgi:hypothetical protein